MAEIAAMSSLSVSTESGILNKAWFLLGNPCLATWILAVLVICVALWFPQNPALSCRFRESHWDAKRRFGKSLF